MKVTKFPDNPGPAGWNAILPEQIVGGALVDRQTADWLIIGAGFAGLSAARRLRQLCPHDKIVVLEASKLAEGPAGRNSGFMIDLPHDLSSHNYSGAKEVDLAQIHQNRTAIEFAADAADDFAMTPLALVQSGKINGAAGTKGQLQNVVYQGHLQALGENSTLLDASEMKEITGSDYYLGGLYTPGCAVLQPALYIREFGDGLRKLGVEIYENSPVVTLEHKGDWRAATAKGSVVAPKVILAVNGHAQSFGHFGKQLLHVYTYATMSAAMSADQIARLGGHGTWGITPADPMGSTVRRISGAGGDRIVVRNRFTYEPNMQVSEAGLAGIYATHEQSFRARFPMLPDLRPEFRWGGHLCLSKNNNFAFGEVEDGLFSACCHNGLGTTKGTFAGISVAELAVGMHSGNAQSLAQSAAPAKLPHAILTKPAVNAIITYKEWRAGREL